MGRTRREPKVSAMCAVLLLLLAASAGAQIPQQMNYQVMLTDDADQPLANESVQLVFRLYNVDAGGGSLWTETHNVTTNSIGVASVILGSTNPLAISFEGPLWLQVEVDGEILSPRRELTSAPYALSVSGGGAGDGHSLDADDGSPTDALYVDSNGYVGIGTTTPNAKLDVDGDVQVGGPGAGKALVVGGTHPDNAAIGLDDVASQGGVLTLRDESGMLQAILTTESTVGGGAYLQLFRNDSMYSGFFLDGSSDGSGEPRMEITGSTRSAIFDMGESGSSSVQLPGQAIDSSEMRDEPGVASRQTSDWYDLPYNSTVSVDSRQIIVPEDGFVFALATAQLELDNSVVQSHYALFGISQSSGAFSPYAQEAVVEVPTGMPGGWLNSHVVVQGLFAVSAGANNFYFLARESDGVCAVRGRQLTLMYFPTNYGIVDVTEEPAGAPRSH